jgi:hypothetical protein
MYETWDTQKRIAEAKRVTARVVDHLQYLLDIHENNAVVLYSDQLSKQVPQSYAANAFNVFREAMHQIELVRICALWDRGDIERESIMTVIELIDDDGALDILAEQARAGHHEEFGKQRAEKARTNLKAAIKAAREMVKSDRLRSIRNLRDKRIAQGDRSHAERSPNVPGHRVWAPVRGRRLRQLVPRPLRRSGPASLHLSWPAQDCVGAAR